jgi:ribosomal protein L40E
VVCIDCGFDKRKGTRLEAVHAGPPRHARSQHGKAPGKPANLLGWTIVAWLVIALGLAGIVGGIGMIYIHSLGPSDTAREEARAQARMMGVEALPAKTYTVETYFAAGLSILLGLMLFLFGVGLRPDRRKNRRPQSENDKRVCTACGGPSPLTAPKCYQCGQAFV